MSFSATAESASWALPDGVAQHLAVRAASSFAGPELQPYLHDLSCKYWGDWGYQSRDGCGLRRSRRHRGLAQAIRRRDDKDANYGLLNHNHRCFAEGVNVLAYNPFQMSKVANRSVMFSLYDCLGSIAFVIVFFINAFVIV